MAICYSIAFPKCLDYFDSTTGNVGSQMPNVVHELVII